MEAEPFNNASLVAQRVAKLLDSGHERWHQDRTAPEFVTRQETLGVQFLAWLERQGEAANPARLIQQALSLARQATVQDAEQRCGAGEEAGHKTENCTKGARRGYQQGQGLAEDAFTAAGRPPSNQSLRAPTRGGPGQKDGSTSLDRIPRQE